MLTYIFIVLFFTVAVIVVMMRKTYAVVPAHELKRQAAHGNALAKQLYGAVGYGLSLWTLLWLKLASASAIGIVLLVSVAPAWFSVLVIAALLWFNFSWLPSTRVTGVSTRVTQFFTPAIVWALQYIDPVLRRVADPISKHYSAGHNGIYELQDLLDLMDLQSQQRDSRITTEEITLIRQVLTFGDKKVRDILRPRAQVKAVALTDTVGPILLDELHASGQTVFPVKKSPRSKEIVASLHLGDLGIHSRGTVEDYVTQGTKYINEADSLADALHEFYQTKQQLFVVIDHAEEFVGVITLEDILHTLVGSPADEHLTDHDDPDAVAERHADHQADKTDETVVE